MWDLRFSYTERSENSGDFTMMRASNPLALDREQDEQRYKTSNYP